MAYAARPFDSTPRPWTAPVINTMTGREYPDTNTDAGRLGRIVHATHVPDRCRGHRRYRSTVARPWTRVPGPRRQRDQLHFPGDRAPHGGPGRGAPAARPAQGRPHRHDRDRASGLRADV